MTTGIGDTQDRVAGTGYRVSFVGTVAPEWIDANDHMNVSFYDAVFDMAEQRFFEEFAIEDDFIRRTRMSFFRLERLVRYDRELLRGDRLEARSRVIWSDFRRVHHFHELWNVDQGYRAAIVDAISIHVDLRARKSAPIELPEVREPLELLLAEYNASPRPEGILPRIDGRRPQS